jgi:hypothetical protein
VHIRHLFEFGIILGLTVWSSEPHAQSCEGPVIYQNHNNKEVPCSIPADRVIYADDRTEECGVEEYRQCLLSSKVKATGIFFGHFNEQNPGDNAATVNCQRMANDDGTRRTIFDKVVKVTDYSYPNDDQMQSTYDAGYDLNKKNGPGQVTWTGMRDLPPYSDHDDGKLGFLTYETILSFQATKGHRTGEYSGDGNKGSNWWFMECTFEATFEVRASDRNPRCGIEMFKSCRTPKHGIDGPVLKKYCPVNSAEIAVFSEVDDKMRNAFLPSGELTCATADALAESNDSEITKKISALQDNLKLLRTAKSSSYIFPKLPSGGVFPTQWDFSDVALAQFQILLELNRLYTLSGGADPKLISEMVAVAPKAVPGASMEAMVDLLVKHRSYQSLQSLKLAFSEQVKQLSARLRPRYIDMNDDKYAFLFADGVTLTDEEIYDAPEKITFSDSSKSKEIYRLSEAAVITGLDQIRLIQNRALDLLDLKVIAYRNSIDYSALAKRLAAISGDSIDKISAALEPQRASAEATRTALVNIISFQIDAANAKVAAKKQLLWKIIDLAAKKSNDPRVPLLAGYRGLNELDASAFAQAIHLATLQAAKATSAKEFENSVQLLVKSAKNNLRAIKILETLNDKTEQQTDALRQSIIGHLAAAAKDSNVGDQLAIKVADAISTLPPGPGMEYGVEVRIQSLIEDIYKQFASALRKVPELKES